MRTLAPKNTGTKHYDDNDNCGSRLDYLFHPRSIALAGASRDPAKRGNELLHGFMDAGYKGQIYPINPGATEIAGLKAYPSVSAIPGPVDYVISVLPVGAAKPLTEDCAAKGVKAIQFYTAGFSETGDPAMKKREEEIVAIARAAGTRVLGPNCVGIYCPETGMVFHVGASKKSGPVGFISQSGGNSEDLVWAAPLRGVYFSKAISFGNAADLNESDFLEYLVHDPATNIVSGYLEGFKNGRKFVDQLRQAQGKKPVIILKGGRTEAGTRAVASHTGSLAGKMAVWDALCQQYGVVQFCSLDELLDMAVAFQYMKPPRGRRVAVIGSGGGASVQAADDCETCGCPVPKLPESARAELRTFTSEVGRFFANPLDSPTRGWAPEQFQHAIKIVLDQPEMDFLIVFIGVDITLFLHDGKKIRDRTTEALITAAGMVDKPIVVVLKSGGSLEGSQAVLEQQARLVEGGLPVYPTLPRAVSAVSRLIAWHERQ
ncbi:MAG: CoA-binding protein [Chloroflexi bacterium]|nr:CoA-binding protein [Chloroflexota bacterium]